MRLRALRFSVSRARQACAAVVLFGVLLGLAGVPVVARGVKDRSKPFPCQDRACGCLSADQCWRHCCCFTNREKLAWAREHGVTPPEFVVTAAATEKCEGTRHCCSAHSGGCCQAVPAEQSAVAPVETEEELTTGLVVSELARRCQGLPEFWQVLSDALPWSPLIQVAAGKELAEVVIDRSASLQSADAIPPIPPPRLTPRDI